MVDLKAKPFYLTDEDLAWVKTTLAAMTDDEKIGQLFCLIAYSSDEGFLSHLARNVKPGGLTCRVMPAQDVIGTVRVLQENSKIPMLISANFEKGGDGIALEGTRLRNPRTSRRRRSPGERSPPAWWERSRNFHIPRSSGDRSWHPPPAGQTGAAGARKTWPGRESP